MVLSSAANPHDGNKVDLASGTQDVRVDGRDVREGRRQPLEIEGARIGRDDYPSDLPVDNNKNRGNGNGERDDDQVAESGSGDMDEKEIERRKKSSDFALLVFAVTSYSVVSIGIVYYNWWLFNSGFEFPVFVSWVQQLVGLLLFLMGSAAASRYKALSPIFPSASIDPKVALRCLPVSFTFVMTIGLSNICLQRVLISTYQVARSLTLPFVIVLSYVVLRERQSFAILVACALMVIGFVIGSLDPSTLSLVGLLAGGFSSLFQSLYNVLIKSSLPHVNHNNQKLVFYNVLLSSFLFLPMVFVVEGTVPWRKAFRSNPGTLEAPRTLWLVWGSMALSGVLGTALNMAQYLVIHVTSPLTFNIVGFTKSIFQSLGGIFIFGDSVTVESALGLCLCLLGSGGYMKAKHDESRRAKADALDLLDPAIILDVEQPGTADEADASSDMESELEGEGEKEGSVENGPGRRSRTSQKRKEKAMKAAGGSDPLQKKLKASGGYSPRSLGFNLRHMYRRDSSKHLEKARLLQSPMSPEPTSAPRLSVDAFEQQQPKVDVEMQPTPNDETASPPKVV